MKRPAPNAQHAGRARKKRAVRPATTAVAAVAAVDLRDYYPNIGTVEYRIQQPGDAHHPFLFISAFVPCIHTKNKKRLQWMCCLRYYGPYELAWQLVHELWNPDGEGDNALARCWSNIQPGYDHREYEQDQAVFPTRAYQLHAMQIAAASMCDNNPAAMMVFLLLSPYYDLPNDVADLKNGWKEPPAFVPQPQGDLPALPHPLGQERPYFVDMATVEANHAAIWAGQLPESVRAHSARGKSVEPQLPASEEPQERLTETLLTLGGSAAQTLILQADPARGVLVEPRPPLAVGRAGAKSETDERIAALESSVNQRFDALESLINRRL